VTAHTVVRLSVPSGLTSEHRLIFTRLVRLEEAALSAGQRDSLAMRSVWLGRSPNSA